LGRRPSLPKGIADPIVTALETARLQLGISLPVTLLIHPDKTIPIVWGIFSMSSLASHGCTGLER